MKVAVASTGQTLDSPLDPRFGRCVYFVIVDTPTMESTAISNPGAASGQGAGVQAAQAVANAGAEAVIASNFGPNAHQALAAGEITVCIANGGSVREAVEALRRGELQVLEQASVPAHFGMGAPAVGGPAVGAATGHLPLPAWLRSPDD